MGWMHRIIDRIVAGQGQPGDIEQLMRISKPTTAPPSAALGDAGGYATPASWPSTATSSTTTSSTSARSAKDITALECP
jgi:NADH:ubiquinone oxidoreductase subunit F (NADH-binding)